MILIGGTDLKSSDLPNSDLMTYSVVSSIKELTIKLKTTAKTPSCIKVYLSDEISKKVTYSHLPKDKVVIYDNDIELISLLEGNDSTPLEDSEEQVEIPAKTVSKGVEVNYSSGVDYSIHDDEEDEEEDIVGVVNMSTTRKKGVEICSINRIPTVDFEEVTTDFPVDLLADEAMCVDTDAIKEELLDKDKIIKQKDDIIKSLMEDKNTMIALHEEQMKKLRTISESKVKEANATIGKLKQTVEDAKLDDYILSFCKYATYTQNKKASSRESFTKEDMRKIGRLSSKIHILASGSDSTYGMLTQIKGLIDSGFEGIIVDFTNANYLRAKYKIKDTKVSSILLGSEGYTVSKLSKDVERTKFIPTTVFNDISLLMLDWVEIIKQLNTFAGGKDIVFLFGSINNFNVRHIVSKLSTIGSLNVFVKCNPVILSGFWGDLKFIPAERVRVIALDYIKVVSTFITELGKTHSVIAFDSNIDWSKLDIDI